MIMNNQIGENLSYPEVNILVTYTHPKKVEAIDHRYQGLFFEVELSKRLTIEEKEGQCAFLSQEWEKELFPFFKFWTVKIYEQK